MIIIPLAYFVGMLTVVGPAFLCGWAAYNSAFMALRRPLFSMELLLFICGVAILLPVAVALAFAAVFWAPVVAAVVAIALSWGYFLITWSKQSQKPADQQATSGK